MRLEARFIMALKSAATGAKNGAIMIKKWSCHAIFYEKPHSATWKLSNILIEKIRINDEKSDCTPPRRLFSCLCRGPSLD